jgi:hypothetical protein
MKPAFVVTVHQSEKYRPNGHELLDTYIKSLTDSISVSFDIFIMENASDKPYDFPSTSNYHYFPNQRGGMTRCWNIGTQLAIENGNDFICVTNEDLIFNQSINNMFDAVENDEEKDITVYGPVCDNPSNKSKFQKQYATELKDGFIDITGQHFPIHGWFLGFTNNYWEKYNVGGFLFDPKRIWRTQESFQQRDWKLGAKSKVVCSSIVHHEHIGSWRKTEKYIK